MRVPSVLCSSMKVLLTTLNAKYIHTNLAIRLLYDLNRDWPGLEWQEFTIHHDRDEIAQRCAAFDVVAFSCYIWNITQTLETARKIKAIQPSTKILLGGPEVSYDWQDVIERPEVDFIITGEGETPFRAFLYAWPDVGHIPNLISKNADGSIRYFSDPAIFDLTEFRDIRPWRNEPPENLAGKVLYVETSRGCPYKCEFCLASLDNKVRYLPDEHIKQTLLYLMEHGRVIKFLDRTFNMKRDFTLDIFRFILDHHRPGNVFQFEITADILHPDIIKFIQEHVPKGLFRFEIGIQTVNQKVNLEVSRKQNFDKTKAIIEAVADKVELHLDLIVGLPLETWDDVKYSFETVFRLYAPELQMGFLKFLKGTPVREKYEQHGFVFDPEPPYEVIESNYLSQIELARLKLVEHALEIYWNKPRAIRTLKYVTERYSVFDFLLGLGACFGEKYEFHKYTLANVYERLVLYAQSEYRHDRILHELIDLDYCLYQKVRPRPRQLLELDAWQKTALIETFQQEQPQAATVKLRYLALPISFDFDAFEQELRIEPGAFQLLISYDGVQPGKTFCKKALHPQLPETIV
ncbi:MAG: B12-binding domain-containing radical SAM protein [Saprospiraceae bacterium]|nr:B12-binding domain-containing radical SAM protein [Saprospiraceae bacterium]